MLFCVVESIRFTTFFVVKRIQQFTSNTNTAGRNIIILNNNNNNNNNSIYLNTMVNLQHS
jgi:hypothetical protein